MRSNYEHAVHDLIEAVESWHVESGQLPMPAFAHHVAEYLTDRGWVRIHTDHDKHSRRYGEDQRQRIAAVIGDTPTGITPDDLTRAVLITLLNPNPDDQETTR